MGASDQTEGGKSLSTNDSANEQVIVHSLPNVTTGVAGAQQGRWGARLDSSLLSTEKEQREMNTI